MQVLLEGVRFAVPCLKMWQSWTNPVIEILKKIEKFAFDCWQLIVFWYRLNVTDNQFIIKQVIPVFRLF